MAEERERDPHGRSLPEREDSETDSEPEGATDSEPEGATDAEPATGGETRGEPPPEGSALRSPTHEGWEVVDISDTPAPSIGPHTTFELPPVEERLARHEQSDVDAMGLDKRREVVGGSYSPSFARQATLYGIFLVVVIALGVGFKLLADELDKPPETNPDVAPWAQEDAPQTPPAQIDFPRNGKTGGSSAPGPEL